MTSIISIDTDGIYTSKKININEINQYLDSKTKKIFNLENYLHIDIDIYDKAFFRETKGKHYILKSNDRLTFHGQSFKGSHQPKFFDECLEQIAKEMFEGKNNRNIDIKSFPIESLMQSIKVKDEGSYKSDNSLSMQLIKDMKKEMPNVKLKDNDQLSYVKTKRGYELVLPGKEYAEIDWNYYNDILNKIYERLQIKDLKQQRFI